MIPEDKITFAAGLSISIREGKVFLRIRDEAAATEFLELEVGQAEFVQALGGLRLTSCVAEIRRLDRLGKVHEHRMLEFPLHKKHRDYDYDKELAREKVHKYCPEGWEPDLSFSSQNSFFAKDGGTWVRTIIRRWVPRPAKEAKATKDA